MIKSALLDAELPSTPETEPSSNPVFTSAYAVSSNSGVKKRPSSVALEINNRKLSFRTIPGKKIKLISIQTLFGA